MSIIDKANRQIDRWRTDAKRAHGYTDAQLAKRLGCSASTLTHRNNFYLLPYYQAMRLKELAQDGETKNN